VKIDIFSIFPGMFEGPLSESLIGKARDNGILKIGIHDLRSFAKDKHHKVDDRPFGGGPGMVIKPDIIYSALKSLKAVKKTKGVLGRRTNKPFVIYMSPQGKTLNSDIAKKLVCHSHLVLLCGHYEGIDERSADWIDEEISIGDYVLTGGELPAMVLVDCLARNIPGVVKEADSVRFDSFYSGLLDNPHYTRPEVFLNKRIPDVLLSGHHKKIEQWRRAQSLIRTGQRRPDLLKSVKLSAEDKILLKQLEKEYK
jgi:tRNA (guanine37-N1)-methyltransferase